MRYVLILLSAATAILASCSNLFTSGVDSTRKGILTVAVSNPNSRNITNSLGATLSDTYEIIAFNGNGHYSAGVAGGATTASLVLPVGTYSVIVLAGASQGTVYGPCLLGTGKTSGVSVAQDETTSTTVTVNAISSSFVAPTEVAASTNYSLTVSGSTGLTEIELSTFCISQSGNYRFSYPNSSVFSITEYYTAPATATTVAYSLNNIIGSFRFNGGTYPTEINGNNNFAYEWNWIGSNHQPIELDAETYRAVNVVATSTGLTVGITWGT